MNWKTYWNRVALQATNTYEAVQRKDMATTLLTAKHIVHSTTMAKEHKVLDLCCGNGLITKRVAPYCTHITGVDQSEILIDAAQNNNLSSNIQYLVGDVLQVSELLKGHLFDIIYIEFSFQYFDTYPMGEKLIAEAIQLLKPGGKLWIGDIPDKKKLFTYYNSFPKLFYLLAGKIRNKSPMGKFWSKRELLKICDKLHIKGSYLEQNSNLPYAWYRFDFLIEK